MGWRTAKHYKFGKPRKVEQNRPTCRISGCTNLARVMYYRVDGAAHYHKLCSTHHMKKYGYYERNLKSVREHQQLPEARVFKLRSRAKRRGVYCELSMADYRKWIYSQRPLCSYCGSKFDNLKELEVDRINPKTGYVIGNLVLSCSRCNIIKSNVFTFSEMQEIANKYDLKKRYAKKETQINENRNQGNTRVDE